MWTCPNCKNEVEPEFDVCWSCGASRDGQLDPDFNPEHKGIMGVDEFKAEQSARMQENLVPVANFRYPNEANAMQARLESEGIRAVTMGEHAASINLFIADSLGGIKVLVLEHDVDRARKIIEDEQERHTNRVLDEEE
jgi:hypothetical protein